jgi:hypothetical protein
MSPRIRVALSVLVVLALIAGGASAADLTASLKKGTPDLKSAGPLAFGPDGVLFVGDPQGACIFAIDTQDRGPSNSAGPLNVEKIDEKVAALLGTTPKEILINDLAVNPASSNAYLSVSRGRGPDAAAVLLRVDRGGKLSALPMKDVKFAKAALPDAPDAGAQERGQSLRMQAITDMAYVDGRVFVAGLSNEEFASKLRAIPFPFTAVDAGTSVEIFHGSHGRFDTRSPVRTFVPYRIGGEDNLLAAYTCTPLVKFPVKMLTPGQHLKGTTVAELGNGNRPLDMIVYQKDGTDYLLLANSSRGMMKITTEGLDKAEAITKPVSGTKGQKYDTIAGMKGVMQLDKFDKDNALVLVRTDSGAMNLDTVPLP